MLKPVIAWWASETSTVIGVAVGAATLVASAPGIHLLQDAHVPQYAIDIVLFVAALHITPKISGAATVASGNPTAEAVTVAAPADTVPASPEKAQTNMTLIQELGLLEAVAGDIVAVASGQPVSTPVKIAGTAYNVSVVVLPNGPGNYQVFSGSFLSILELVFTDAAAFAAGAPIQIGEKIGNTWYGTTLSKAA